MKLRYLSLLLLVSCQTVSRKPAAEFKVDICDNTFESTFEIVNDPEHFAFGLAQMNYLNDGYLAEVRQQSSRQCAVRHIDQRLSRIAFFTKTIVSKKLMFDELQRGQVFTDKNFPEKAACFAECTGKEESECEQKCKVTKKAVEAHQFFQLVPMSRACYNYFTDMSFRKDRFQQHLTKYLPLYRKFMIQNKKPLGEFVDALFTAEDKLKKLKAELAPAAGDGECADSDVPIFNTARKAVFAIQQERKSETSGQFTVETGTGFWVQGKDGEARFFTAHHVRNDKGTELNGGFIKMAFDGTGTSDKEPEYRSEPGFFNFGMDITQGTGDFQGPFLPVVEAGRQPRPNQKFYLMGFPAAGGGAFKTMACYFRGYSKRIQPKSKGTTMQFYCDQPYIVLEGMSGGPVIDDTGTVWGVITERADPSGLIFASPIFRASDGDLQMGFQGYYLSDLCLNPKDWSSYQRCQLMPNQFEKQIP